MMRTALLLMICSAASAADAPSASKAPARSPREALRAFHDLIGSWKGTGTPASGSREERDRRFWIEMIRWQWQFKGKDVWLQADVDKGKHFSRFELRYQPKSDDYTLTATTADKKTVTFTGKLANKRLTLDSHDTTSKQTHRLVFSLLHANRYLYAAETRPAGATGFVKLYQVGATKQGVAFASDDKGNECIVSGGLGTMAVSYKGKTYYVCCSGCRDAFKEDPEKYIKEAEAARKK